MLIADGTEPVEGMFFGRISGDSCQIVLMDRSQLDREVNSKLSLEIALKTLSAFANKRKSKATVSFIALCFLQQAVSVHL